MKYEGVFIFSPSTEEEKRNAFIERVETIINENGSVENVDEWGMRKLAYLIDKLSEGYYILLDFNLEDKELLKEIDRITKINDDVIRHMVVKA